MDEAAFDYVIVGGGSAGCVLAERLSAHPAMRVALIEDGPGVWSPFVDMPRAWVTLGADRKRSWRFAVEPSEGRAAETWARGRGLGGSSAVNGMIYCRGQPQDYDGWRAFGVTGWDWSDIEPAFRAIEDVQDGTGPGRGQGGPLAISRRKLEPTLEAAIFAAAEGLGLDRLADLNGPERAGVGYYDHTISRAGVRPSTACAFLKPARRRPNLVVMRRTRADRILFSGRRADGIEICRGGRLSVLKARREVVVSAGAILSPTLLQVSGVGDGAALAAHGVGVVHDNPAVGRNLAEHLVLALPHALNGLAGHNREFRGGRLLLNLARYYALGTGVLSYGASEIGGFVRSHGDLDRPDLQLAMSPYSFRRASTGPWPQPDVAPGFTIIGYMLRPESRGSVRLGSAKPGALPKIEPGWLGTEGDRRTAVRIMDVMREFVRQPALSGLVGPEIAPGADIVDFEAKLSAFRAMFVSGLHAVGTCRMGEDEGAVVDSRLRVHGVEGLRVVDASVIPAPISGNTNGPVMALAWRAAAMILADADLKR